MFKWGNMHEVQQGQERMNKLFAKLVSSKVIYTLALLAAFALMSGAANKWTG